MVAFLLRTVIVNMLRTILIISSSGLVLFIKEFLSHNPPPHSDAATIDRDNRQLHANSTLPPTTTSTAEDASSSSSPSSTSIVAQSGSQSLLGRMKTGQLGGIIVAMLQLSVSMSGLPVRHLQLDHVSITISTSQRARVTCAVFYDSDDVSLNHSFTPCACSCAAS